MLLTNNYDVKLEKMYQRIETLCPAYNDTFVFVALVRAGNDKIVHCNKNGKILFEYNVNDTLMGFNMFNDREIIIPVQIQSAILVINLVDYSIIRVPHPYAFELSVQTDIATFFETKYVCIYEHGLCTDHRLRMTYYAYPLTAESKPISVYESQEGDWTYEQQPITKINNHSMMGWWKYKHSDKIQFTFWDLRDSQQGKLTKVSIKNTLSQMYEMNKLDFSIHNLWQKQKNQFILAGWTPKVDLKKLNAAGSVVNTIVVDIEKETVREANFWFDAKYNEKICDQFYLGDYSIYHTFDFEKGDAQLSTVYYVNNLTEQIVAQDLWRFGHETKYFFPSYDSSVIGQFLSENGDVQEFKCNFKKLINPKEISLYFLLHINENFDDDLLGDAIKFLEGENN